MREPVIQLRRFGFRYPGVETDSLSDIDLEVERGDFLAVIGGNGGGKTTLCKTFNGLIPHFYNGDWVGEVLVAGRPTSSMTVDELSKLVGYVCQDFESQLVRPTVYDEIAFAPLNYGMSDYRERAERALDLLELRELKDRFVWQLSGGQKHLVALAGALALEPEAIVVDEPAAQLDPAHARLIYDKLRLLNERYGKTIVVIEHHTEFIADYCRHVVLIDRGRLRWRKPVREALNEVDELSALRILPPQVTQAAYRLQANDAVPRGEQRHPLPVTVEEGVRYMEELASGSFAAFVTDVGEPPQHVPSGEPVVRLAAVSHSYRTIDKQTVRALRDIDLCLHEGDRVVVVGSNGAGKSTLLKLLTGAAKPESGTISILGEDAKRLSPEQIADRVAYIYQNPEQMFIADHIREDISYFPSSRSMEGVEAHIDELVGLFRLKELEHRDGRLLSGGQQRRASLAIGMAMKPRIMLLDEPTSSLDVSSRKELVRMLEMLGDRVKTVLVATHDMQLAAEWANRVIVMHCGEIAADTTPRQLFAQPSLLNLCGLRVPQITELSARCGMNPPAISVEEFVNRIETGCIRHEVC